MAFIRNEKTSSRTIRSPQDNKKQIRSLVLRIWKEAQGSERSFRQKAKPDAGNGVERTLRRRCVATSTMDIADLAFILYHTLTRLDQFH